LSGSSCGGSRRFIGFGQLLQRRNDPGSQGSTPVKSLFSAIIEYRQVIADK
jgi:hypothetical protein